MLAEAGDDGPRQRRRVLSLAQQKTLLFVLFFLFSGQQRGGKVLLRLLQKLSGPVGLGGDVQIEHADDAAAALPDPAPQTDTGAEAPAVTPTRAAPATQAGSMHSAPSIRKARAPCFSASSRRRLEFELFTEPTTSTTSHWPARMRTASWRFWVA